MTGRGRRIRHPVPVVLVAAAAAIGLAGCVAATPPAAPSATTAPSFPAVQGRTLSTSDDGGSEWQRVVRVRDSDVAYRQARRLLVDGGFTLTKDREGTGGGDGQACTAMLCVGFTATDGTDAGPIVEYDWFHPDGIVG